MAVRSLQWLNVALDSACEAIEGGPGAMISVSDELTPLCRDIKRWVGDNPRSGEIDWILGEMVESCETVATMWAEQAQHPDKEALRTQWNSAVVVFVQALVTVQAGTLARA